MAVLTPVACVAVLVIIVAAVVMAVVVAVHDVVVVVVGELGASNVVVVAGVSPVVK